ncbi:molybdate ABC transporter permease subunit [Gloeobacter kilaueensis]|uniref:Molybdenum transport system permease n=1 Tax=Gloeobacter kilaueensis (strain ATCC BAA-2537 / CCAP 1431/1 / ULC 316 / JS1) TaxID=1183438 RepID=U5QN41_GLOK1|nr:molybdate ABC transporter permease subunit [Gloeobacter kilaueensis]AGY60397.1 molybdate transport system permease protein [Gloeobacter kilaueensis JS1]
MGELTFSLQLSLWVAGTATLIAGLVGTAAAYVLAKYRFWGEELVEALLTLPLVLPPTVVGFYLLGLLGRRGWLGQYLYAWTGLDLLFTPQAAVIAAAVMALPLMVRTARAAIEGVDPLYEQAAFTLGKSRLETFLQVTLPLAWRGLLAGLVLSFARALGEFGATLMVAGNIPRRTQTMPLAIYEATQAGEDRRALVLVAVLSLVSLVVLLLTNRLGPKKRW